MQVVFSMEGPIEKVNHFFHPMVATTGTSINYCTCIRSKEGKNLLIHEHLLFKKCLPHRECTLRATCTLYCPSLRGLRLTMI